MILVQGQFKMGSRYRFKVNPLILLGSSRWFKVFSTYFILVFLTLIIIKVKILPIKYKYISIRNHLEPLEPLEPQHKKKNPQLMQQSGVHAIHQKEMDLKQVNHTISLLSTQEGIENK